MKRQFDGKVVLVTGASRGIGKEIALAFARQGARLVLAARSEEALKRVQQEIREMGLEALSIPTDVTSELSVDALVAGVQKHFGRLDVLVNNAGIGRVGGVESPTFEKDVRETLQASLFGMVRVTQRVLPIFRQQGSGTVVNMSSVMGRKAFADFGSYAIVMHAVSAFSDALRQECAGANIQVSVIHPALTATDLLREANESRMPAPFRHMTPLPPEYVGNAVVEAVSRKRPRVVLPRTANMLLLGEALSPRLGDAIARALAVRPVAWMLGMSRGQNYHQAISQSPVEGAAASTAKG